MFSSLAVWVNQLKERALLEADLRNKWMLLYRNM